VFLDVTYPLSYGGLVVSRRQPHRCSGLATLPSAEAISGYLASDQIFNASQTSAHVGSCARRLRQRSSPHAPCVLPSATEPSRWLLHLFGTVCRRQFVHRRHCQFSAEDWRLNFLSGLTAVLPHERLTVLTTMWPHIFVTCPCSPRTLCHVKSIRYHHHHHPL